eukprot:1161868-Pelagomonas_calceolata.AAC.17
MHTTRLSIEGVPGRIHVSEATRNLLLLVLGTESIDHVTLLSIEGVPGRIHVSEATRNLLPQEEWEATGGVEVKGKVGMCVPASVQCFAMHAPLQLIMPGAGCHLL